jgi:hypothetical protein
VQLPLVEATLIRDIDIGFGYTNFDIIADKHMIEFHIVYCNRWTTAQVPISRTGRQQNRYTAQIPAAKAFAFCSSQCGKE